MRMVAVALSVSVATFLVSVALYTGFDNTATGMQFVEKAPWVASMNVFYALGVDGISAPLILLTTFITPLVIIAGWNSITNRPAQYFAAFLILEGLMVGVFLGAGRIAVLRVLGSHADTDVPDHWHLGRQAPYLRDLEVLPVHIPRLGPDAGRVYLPVRTRPVALTCSDLWTCTANADGAETDLRRVPAGIRRQGTDVAGAYLVTGRTR